MTQRRNKNEQAKKNTKEEFVKSNSSLQQNQAQILINIHFNLQN